LLLLKGKVYSLLYADFRLKDIKSSFHSNVTCNVVKSQRSTETSTFYCLPVYSKHRSL
jgi:hypothetical protein